MVKLAMFDYATLIQLLWADISKGATLLLDHSCACMHVRKLKNTQKSLL